jgi:hypothetical protein
MTVKYAFRLSNLLEDVALLQPKISMVHVANSQPSGKTDASVKWWILYFGLTSWYRPSYMHE